MIGQFNRSVVLYQTVSEHCKMKTVNVKNRTTDSYITTSVNTAPQRIAVCVRSGHNYSLDGRLVFGKLALRLQLLSSL